MFHQSIRNCILLILLASQGPVSFAQCDTTPATKISSTEGIDPASFGFDIAIDGDYLAVWGWQAEATNLNHVLIFHFDGINWVLEAELAPAVPQAGDYFGHSISLRGDRILIGASHDNERGGWAGSAYVFRRNGVVWTQEAKLFSPSPHSVESFGYIVALGENVALIRNNESDFDRPIYSYRLDSGAWIAEAPITCPVSYCEDFGLGVAISQDLALIRSGENGAQVASPRGAGFVYRRENNSWIFEAKLAPPVGSEYWGDALGWSGAIGGNRAVLYSAHISTNQPFSLIYKRTGTTWALEAAIPAVCNCYSVEPYAIQDDTLLMANYAENSNKGAVYAYRYDGVGWTQTARISLADGLPLDRFGFAVALSGTRAAISAIPSNTPDTRPGAAYIIETGDCNANGTTDVCDIEDCAGDPACADCNRNGLPDSCDIASGAWADADADGVPDLCGCDPTPPASPLAEATPYPKNRFISFEPQQATGRLAAVRVKLNSLHHPDPPYTAGAVSNFSSFEGQFRWLGPVQQFLESTSTQTPFSVSQLQCSPYYTDWSPVGLLHVYGYEIVPSSSYDVQTIDFACGSLAEENFSAPLTISTARWGDIVEPFNPPATATQPDLGDVAELVSKFKSLPGAAIKARALLAGVLPKLDLNVSFEEISNCVDAFKGRPYPYPGPLVCP